MSVLLADATVRSAERLSPSFVRVELGGDALAELGVDGPWFDQRVKLVVPASGSLPRVADLGVGQAGAPDDWYAAWCAMPEERRGAMRTYSVRAVRGEGPERRLVVDVVLHPGAHGPGSAWAAGTAPGDRVLLVAPRRGEEFGGIEFAPPERGHMLLVADESAVPAVASILGDWPDGLTGTAYLEVPGPGDVLPDLPIPPAVEVTWLPRRPGVEAGDRLLDALHARLGPPRPQAVSDRPVAGDPSSLTWETPTFSVAGEPVDAPPAADPDDLHAWVAGESGWVTAVRRLLVRGHGMERSRVAFMGYWRRGVAMKA